MRRRDFLKLIGVACVAPVLPEVAQSAGASPVYPAYYAVCPTGREEKEEFCRQLKDTSEWKRTEEHINDYFRPIPGEFGSFGGMRFIRTK